MAENLYVACPQCHKAKARAEVRGAEGEAILDCPICGRLHGTVLIVLEKNETRPEA
jgi:uncharacterized Zn finger protein